LKNYDDKTPPKIKEKNPEPHEIILNDSKAWISKETLLLQPRAKNTVLGKEQGENPRNPSRLLCTFIVQMWPLKA
jgi:hypothetical protein